MVCRRYRKIHTHTQRKTQTHTHTHTHTASNRCTKSELWTGPDLLQTNLIFIKLIRMCACMKGETDKIGTCVRGCAMFAMGCSALRSLMKCNGLVIMRSTHTLLNLLPVVYLSQIYTETVLQLKQKWIAPPECVFVVLKQQQTLCVCHALHAKIPKSDFIDIKIRNRSSWWLLNKFKMLFISDCQLNFCINVLLIMYYLSTIYKNI